MMILKAPDQQVRAAPPVSAWMDASLHPLRNSECCILLCPVLPQGLSGTEDGNHL